MDGNPGVKPGGGIFDLLFGYVDSVVTIYTECHCFTGLLCSVHCGFAKLITKYGHGCPCCNCYGKVTIIPVCEIVAVTLCNTSA